MQRFTIRLAALAAALCLAATAASAQLGFQAGVDLDLLNYQHSFITPTLSVEPLIGKDMELQLGAGFGTYVANGEACFQIPLKAGVNFLFPFERYFEFYLQIGILPQVAWSADGIRQPFIFLVGPYAGGGLRFRLHPLMSLFVEVQQTLLIGAPLWINTGTRIGAGMQFRLDDGRPDQTGAFDALSKAE